jgi:hypothetical protein
MRLVYFDEFSLGVLNQGAVVDVSAVAVAQANEISFNTSDMAHRTTRRCPIALQP